MIRRFNDWRLSKKMGVAFGLLACLVATLGISGFLAISAVEKNAEALLDTDLTRSEASDNLYRHIREYRTLLYTHVTAIDEEEVSKTDERIVKNKAELAKWYATYEGIAGDAEKAELGKLKGLVGTLEQENEQILAVSRDRTRQPEAIRMLKEARKTSNAALEEAEKMIALARTSAEANAAQAKSAATWATALGVVLMLIALAICGFVWRVVNRTVAVPMATLSAVTKALAEGGKAEVPSQDRADELGEIAKAVEMFRAANDRAEDDARKAEEQKRVTADLAGGLDALARGDLTSVITSEFPGSYAVLKTNFNTAVERLRTMIGSVGESAETIRNGSEEIARASEDLSRRTEQNAASLEETAAAMTEITATVQNSAAGANEANKLVQATQSDAQASSKTVADAISAMAEIEQSSQQINRIIEVIDKIAFQTNLLALNASVEAAHAGEAGRAFAVVANEVRALAQRSADAAQEIGELISTSTRQVDTGVQLVGQAGTALGRIIGSVDEISGLVSQIAMAADQQSSALSQVNATINDMDKVTQQNAAMVEETSAAARNLRNEVESLADQASQFVTGAGMSAGDVRAVKAVASPAPQRRRNSVPARQSNLAVAADAWNQF